MTNRQTILYSRQVVTPGSVIAAHVVIEDGLVAAIDAAGSASDHADDLGDDVLIPGLVDVHTDNLEKHYQPRPGALWDAMGAALAHDAQCATAGITTVFDSLSLHGRKDGLDRKEALGPMIAGMDAAARQGFLKAEHLLHLRCEITNPDLMTLVEPQLSNPRLRLLSVMDHTPGQRQTANIGQFRERMIASGKTGTELDEVLARRTEWRDQAAAPANRRAVVAIARAAGIPLMSHDDMTAEHVEESRDDGCVASEFPVTLEAARLAREFGMKNIMGAPNFVRGGSHSGNLSARACAAAGLLDALASDYVPLSMIRAAFLLVEPPFNWPLPDAIATVAANPARLCGLLDRGEIAVGQRADLARIAMSLERWPTVRMVWRGGVRVA